MRTSLRLSGAIFSLLISACAAVYAPPAAEVRQALAPSGTLRVGVLPDRPWSMVVDSRSGETGGVGYELGKALAQRLGVPFQAVVLSTSGEFVDALTSGKADVILGNATPARARDVDFTAPVIEIEQGYLVRADSPVAAITEVDRPGVRVGVSAGSTSAAILSRELKGARLLDVPSLRTAVEMLGAGTLDVYASNKATLLEMAGGLPGSRVLAGRYGVERMALGIPKGRDRGMPYLRRFAEESVAGGLVERAAARAGLGAVPRRDAP